jgi:dolichyl-phosphate beta-glucosyltransferase
MTSSTYQLLEYATPELSIVIPAYNEEARIGRTLDSIASFLAERSVYCEVVVVDDGSTDDTGAIVEARQPDFVSLRLLRCERNGGKGRAVRLGMMVARGRVRLFMDADNSTDIREFERLNDTAARDASLPDVVIASIATPGSHVEGPQPRTRAVLGRLGSALVQRTVLPGIHDTQRGFKVFTAEAADAIFSRCRINGWGFDIEVLAVARSLGFHILEVPVNWRHEADSRVGATAYLTTLIDVARVRRLVRKTRRGAEDGGSGQDADTRHGLRVG